MRCPEHGPATDQQNCSCDRLNCRNRLRNSLPLRPRRGCCRGERPFSEPGGRGRRAYSTRAKRCACEGGSCRPRRQQMRRPAHTLRAAGRHTGEQSGIFEPKPFTDISDADWLRFFEVNVLSGVRLSRFYLPGMLKRNWGRIVFISSESGLNIPVEMIHYGVTKTAQIALARGLAEMTGGTSVTVNSVLAGPTRSEGVEGFLQEMAKAQGSDTATLEKEFFRSVRPSSLLKRFATPLEVAHLVVYVSSPLASATNGAALRVEGGVVRSIV